MTSCATTTKTATTAEFKSQILTATVADLDVAPERVSCTYTTTKAVRRGGVANVRRAAEQELLNTMAPGYDMIVEPQFVEEKTSFLFWSKVKKMTVSGRPAKYVNTRSLNDSVWVKRAFREYFSDQKDKDNASVKGLLRKLFGKKK